MKSFKIPALVAAVAVLVTASLPLESPTNSTTVTTEVAKVWVSKETHPWVPCVEKSNSNAMGEPGCYIHFKGDLK